MQRSDVSQIIKSKSGVFPSAEEIIWAGKKKREAFQVIHFKQILSCQLILRVSRTEWAVSCSWGETGRKCEADGTLASCCLLATLSSCVCWPRIWPQWTSDYQNYCPSSTSVCSYLRLCPRCCKWTVEVLAWFVSLLSKILIAHLLHAFEAAHLGISNHMRIKQL